MCAKLYPCEWQRGGSSGLSVCRRQFGVAYRFLGVFVENGKWKRLACHPLLAVVMYLERFMVGLVYLLKR